MACVYLQDMADDIRFDDLPVNWVMTLNLVDMPNV